MHFNPEGDTCFIKGIVKDVEEFFSFSPEGEIKFYKVVIETEYGDMQLCHSADVVAENERCHIKKGACLTTDCVVSGDVAVGKYQNGAIYDEISLLKLLKECMDNNEYSRAANIFYDTVEYKIDEEEMVGVSKQEILDKFKKVSGNNGNKYYTYIFRVSDYKGENAEDKKRENRFCLGICYGTPARIGTLLFIDLNEDKKIKSLRNLRSLKYNLEIIDNNPICYDEDFELCLLKDSIDERNIMKSMNIFDRYAEFVLEDELLSSINFNTFMYIERFFEGLDKHNLDVNTFIVKLVGRYDQVPDEHVGKKAIALSFGNLEEYDGLYIVERNAEGLISKITSVGGNNYIIEDITPAERYALPKLIYDKSTFVLPVDERERLDFVIAWLNDNDDFESDFKFYKALDEECKLVLDVSGRKSESVGNEEAITALRILANRECNTKEIFIEDGYIVVDANSFGCYVYVTWNEIGLISELKIVDFR
jgi:hypothetical protein